MHRRLVPLLLSLLVFCAGCGQKRLLPNQPATEVSSTEQASSGLASERSTRDRSKRHDRGAATIIGRKDGAIYALYRPEHWNKSLVLFAHGYIPPDAPIALPREDNVEALRDLLLARGYAVAYSSFSRNGYAVQEGVRGTEDALERFEDELGRPRRVYLVGPSLGGLIVLDMAEQHPRRFDGVLPISGIVGGSRFEITYVANVRVLFDYFYPGVLPGDLLHLPANLNMDRDLIGPAVAAMQAHPEGAFAMSQIVQTPIPFASPEELVQSIVQALVLQAIQLRDLLSRTRGESFLDNQDTRYSGSLPPALLADLNQRVARYRTGRDADLLFEKFYEPTGRLEIPMLALHTSRDPVAPVQHEDVYRARVAAAHRLENLRQKIDVRYGHVGYTTQQLADAFFELVQWVEGEHKNHAEPALAGARED